VALKCLKIAKELLAKRVLDQYGNAVHVNDLVLLPDIEWLDKSDVKTVERADWYEYDGVLMAPYKQLKGLSEDDPRDAGINLNQAEDGDIMYVNDVLKRFNPRDGFYHA